MMGDIEDLRHIDFSSKEGQWELTAKENFRLLMEARDKTEELEKALKEALGHRQEIIDLVLAGEHLEFITHKQIDAAWEWIHKEWNGAYSTIGRWMLRFLERFFGIVRCEGCHGIAPPTDLETGETRSSCPDCEGHGWVKGP